MSRIAFLLVLAFATMAATCVVAHPPPREEHFFLATVGGRNYVQLYTGQCYNNTAYDEWDLISDLPFEREHYSAWPGGIVPDLVPACQVLNAIKMANVNGGPSKSGRTLRPFEVFEQAQEHGIDWYKMELCYALVHDFDMVSSWGSWRS